MDGKSLLSLVPFSTAVILLNKIHPSFFMYILTVLPTAMLVQRDQYKLVSPLASFHVLHHTPSSRYCISPYSTSLLFPNTTVLVFDDATISVAPDVTTIVRFGWTCSVLDKLFLVLSSLNARPAEVCLPTAIHRQG